MILKKASFTKTLIAKIFSANPTHVEKTRGKTTTRYNVEGVIIHPGFVKGKLYNDFALVKLSEDAQFGPGTKVFCLKPDNNISESKTFWH